MKKSIQTVLDGDIFELKNMRVYEELSDETTACSAELWLNGKHVGFVRNSGQGEGNYPNFKDKACIDEMEVFETHLKSHTHHVGPYPFAPEGVDLPYDLDLLIGLMVEAAYYDDTDVYTI